ncbi:MAG: hypothetical protein ACETWM_12560 [Candidatus Lokiarchaeia archaeon]
MMNPTARNTTPIPSNNKYGIMILIWDRKLWTGDHAKTKNSNMTRPKPRPSSMS